MWGSSFYKASAPMVSGISQESELTLLDPLRRCGNGLATDQKGAQALKPLKRFGFPAHLSNPRFKSWAVAIEGKKTGFNHWPTSTCTIGAKAL